MEKTLIVDDLSKWHAVAEKNLNFYGFKNLIHCYNIIEGRELYKFHKPDLVLTDINFDTQDKNDLDGLVLCTQIKDLSLFIQIPTKIVVMSSNEDIKERAIECGADYFINKKNFVGDFDGFIKEFYPSFLK